MTNQHPIQNPKVAFRIIDGTAVLINPEDSTFYTLNSVATRIWELADGQTPITNIVNRICEEFEVSQEVALQNTEAFLQAFNQKGLIMY